MLSSIISTGGDVVHLLKPEREVNLSHIMYDMLWDVIVKEKHVEKMDERLKLIVVVNTV